MAEFIHAKVQCSSCAHVFDGDIAPDLHISTRPDIREDIVAGRFHRFQCPRCEAWTTIEKLLAYTDFERHDWFTVVPTVELPFLAEWRELAEQSFQATMVEHCPPLVREQLAPRMRKRLIFGLASLREKLIAFDHGLDDRVLEVFKLAVLRERGVLPDALVACHLSAVTPDTLELDLVQPGSPPLIDHLTIDRMDYDRLAAKDKQLAGRWPGLFNDIAVDMRTLFIAPAEAQAVSEGSLI